MWVNRMEVKKYKDVVANGMPKGFYIISEDGEDIISLRTKKSMAITLDKDGYRKINLTNGNDHIRRGYRVAALVQMAFNGMPPSDMVDPTVDHIDGNKRNDHYSNLRWLERSMNSSLKRNPAKGERNGSAILNQKEVVEICMLLNSGFSLNDIAKMYNVEKSTISNIRRGVTWPHITGYLGIVNFNEREKEILYVFNREYVEEKMKTENITIKEMADRYGCSYDRMSAVIRGRRSKQIHKETGRKIAKILNVNFEDVVKM